MVDVWCKIIVCEQMQNINDWNKFFSLKLVKHPNKPIHRVSKISGCKILWLLCKKFDQAKPVT